jgi:GTP-binding protein
MSSKRDESSSRIINAIPRVAIIGRPNVGKSTLFNILTGIRRSVVKDQPGVTRDIIIEPCEVWGKHFDLIDTGGITEAHDTFSQLIKEQVTEFLGTVDFLIVVMDGRSGLLPEDRQIIQIANETGKAYLLVVNKLDKQHEEDVKKAEFFEFGEDVIGTSFETRRGVSDILEWLHHRLPENPMETKEGLTIALVGKPNVGKSSLCNRLLGEKRMIVSEIAGTTIDSVDSPFLYNGKKYILVDTAGLRRSSRREDHLEIISAFKAKDSIRRADLVLLLIDGTEGPTDQDAKILQAITEEHKAVIVVANKSDLGFEIPEYRKRFQEQIERQFHFFTDVPYVFTSAKTGAGLKDLLEKIEWAGEKLNQRIKTADLNEFFFNVIRKAPAPVYGIHNVKFYYLTQTFQKPPSFIAFANHPDGVDNAYRRFVLKNLKDHFDLKGMPLRLYVMNKGGRD